VTTRRAGLSPGPSGGPPRRAGQGNARDVAYEVLRRVRRDGAYATLALSSAVEPMPPVDRHLATELVYGVLRHQRRLDHALARHARLGLERVDPEVLDLLRIAAYQMLLLDRVPDYAAVDHAVGAVRRLRGARVAGFANAVLRKLTSADLDRDLPSDAVQRLALRYSLPDTLAGYFWRQLGQQEAEKLAAVMLDRAPLNLRANQLRATTGQVAERLQSEGVKLQPGRWLESALRVESADLFRLASHGEGLWSVQDEAAQLVGLALGPEPGQTVLDACAGVGGKAMHIATLIGDRGRVVCGDLNPRKLALLTAEAHRLGVTCCEPLVGDLRRIALPRADRVLVDAPCTGLGVLRRHPEIKWREDSGLQALDRLVQLQRELLEAVLAALKPGGVLVYSVCTVTDEEGPRQVERLLERHPELALDPFPPTVPELDHNTRGAPLRLWPQRHDLDGFFIARVRRMQ